MVGRPHVLEHVQQQLAKAAQACRRQRVHHERLHHTLNSRS